MLTTKHPMLSYLTRLFPLWMCLSVAHALWMPKAWLPLNNPTLTVAILGVVMLGMGLTLSIDDFRRIGRTASERARTSSFAAHSSTRVLNSALSRQRFIGGRRVAGRR